MQPAWWRVVSLALLFGVLAQQPAWAQKPAPTGTQELVAVLELDGVGATKGELAAATEELRAQLLHSGRFRVVDRQQVDALLKEQAFQQTGCTSQECAVQVGKMLGVRKIVTGRITRIDKALWQAAAQMVDVESGETLRAETVTQRGAFDALLGEGLAALTAKLTGGGARTASVATPPSEAPKSRDTWPDPITGMEFIWVPGGTFEMGCGAWGRDCDSDEKPPHQVTVSGFWLGKTEVTQGQWTRIMGSNPSKFKKGDDYPVEQVSWDDAQQYIAKLNGQSSGASFRLATEAEWEFACRAGGKERVYGTQTGELSSDAANYYESGKQATTPVASYAPNGLGLYDMSGNVVEWVQDAYDSGAYAHMAAVNPLNSSGADRVYRGGGWDDFARDVRCSYRNSDAPSAGSNDLGLRLARPK